MKRLAMVGVLAVAAAAALPAESRADVRVGVVVVRADHRGSSSAQRYGYDRGWKEGAREGRSDARRGRDARYWREGDFRDADSGYRHWMGPHSAYVNGYRQGYAAGYRHEYAASRPGWRDRRDRRDDEDSRR